MCKRVVMRGKSTQFKFHFIRYFSLYSTTTPRKVKDHWSEHVSIKRIFFTVMIH